MFVTMSNALLGECKMKLKVEKNSFDLWTVKHLSVSNGYNQVRRYEMIG